ncbi:MAG: Asr1405/Asl0597 family protein [Cyanobacteria bacterium P01_A01_bin.84]
MLEPSISQAQLQQNLDVMLADRWEIYRRLQELDIPCWYGEEKVLTVTINHVAAAIQVWSVMRSLNASRRDLILGLERCWKM